VDASTGKRVVELRAEIAALLEENAAFRQKSPQTLMDVRRNEIRRQRLRDIKSELEGINRKPFEVRKP
jgi:hypothetical protein